jgi:hypothetical protein
VVKESENQHRIAVAVEAIFALDGDAISKKGDSVHLTA